jgi:hypothetical protein
MRRIELLDPTQNDRSGEHLENKLRHLIVGQDEAIHQIVRSSDCILRQRRCGIPCPNIWP